MQTKVDGVGTSPRFHAHEAGLSWIAHPEEGMERASHALATDGGVWLLDPVDAAGLDERIAELGDVRGVVVLLDRHERDSVALAKRCDVPIHRPPGVQREFDAPTEDVSGHLPGTGYEFLSVTDFPGWREVGLWNGETLVVPEALGTNAFSRVGDEPIGLNPVSRLFPPKQLRRYEPARVLFGHGPPVEENAAAAIDEALGNARRRLPRAWLDAARALL